MRFFQIGGIPSVTLRKVVADHNYRLLPLPFSESFSLDHAGERAVSGSLQLNRGFRGGDRDSCLHLWSSAARAPPPGTRTIATRLLIVGNQGVDNRTVRKVLELIFSPEISGLAKAGP